MEELVPQGQGARRLVPFMAGLSALGLVMLTAAVAAGGPPRVQGYGASLFAVGALAVLYLLLWLRNARLVIGPGTIGQRNLIGQTTTIATSDIGRVVIATVRYSKNATPQRALYVIGADGRQLMALNTRAWGDGAIGRLVEASGRNVEYRDGTISAREFRAEFPKAVGFAAMHPTLLGTLLVVVALGLGLGIPIGLVLAHR